MPAIYLLDIEGTTTPIDFVTRTLFPYARKRLGEYVGSGSFEEQAQLAEERQADLHAPSSDLAYLEWLMDQDRKSTVLKSIQGKIWKQGYASGELMGEVYPDVVPAMRRWHAAGKMIAIYSSGSILAQKLIFSHLPEGDVTPMIGAHFDTTTGPKKDSQSYDLIADQLEVFPSEILFLSDSLPEVLAAREAGLQVRQVVRPAEHGDLQMDPSISVVADFEQL